jgi:TPR repeat protein
MSIIDNPESERSKQLIEELYRQGTECTKGKNFPKAYDLFKKAAIFGHSAAMVNVGWLLYCGKGVSKDEQQASFWFKQAVVVEKSKEKESVRSTEHQESEGSQDTSHAVQLLTEKIQKYEQSIAQMDECVQQAMNAASDILHHNLNTEALVNGLEKLSLAAPAPQLKTTPSTSSTSVQVASSSSAPAAQKPESSQSSSSSQPSCERVSSVSSSATIDPSSLNALALVQVMERNMEKAIELFQKAADAGDVRAINNLGAVYSGEIFVINQKDATLEICTKSSLYAEFTPSNADLYEGPKKQQRLAQQWLKTAADTKLPAALYNLALIKVFQDQNDVVQKYVFHAVVQEHVASIRFMASMFHLRKVDFKTNRYLEMAANLKDIPSLIIFADRILQKKVAGQDCQKALALYKQAASLGSPEAMFRLGRIRYHGGVVTKDTHNAFSWFLKAAQLGHEASVKYVISMYTHGDGVTQSAERAAFWQRQIARNNKN